MVDSATPALSTRSTMPEVTTVPLREAAFTTKPLATLAVKIPVETMAPPESTRRPDCSEAVGLALYSTNTKPPLCTCVLTSVPAA